MNKQETIEEVAEKTYQKGLKDDLSLSFHDGVKFGAKWQQERMYSEEDIKSAFKVGFSIGYGSDVHAIDEKNRTCEKWFEQYKTK
jgi:hypothetical protein